ncbi:hypothetical protein ACFU39_28485 [Bacillus tropicus]|uniref:hypothetical protein n=1 Tax=Bacillus tropicus TaxID=2026188 RepID=UPI0035D64CC7
MWNNLSDNLSIVGIYYFLVSIFWLVNMKTIDTVTEETGNWIVSNSEMRRMQIL